MEGIVQFDTFNIGRLTSPGVAGVTRKPSDRAILAEAEQGQLDRSSPFENAW